MACVGGPSNEQVAAQERAARKKLERSRKKKLDAERRIGILLCEACSLLDEAGLLNKAGPKLRAWYKAHQHYEKDRVAEEAKAKLTKRELRALGLLSEGKKNVRRR